MIEKTLIIIKPGGVERGLVGEIIRRFENKNLQIVALKYKKEHRHTLEKLYKEHKKKKFYHDLIEYMTSGESVSFVVEGDNAISAARSLIGNTDPSEAVAGSIRGDFGVDVRHNIVHSSDSQISAMREISILFPTYFKVIKEANNYVDYVENFLWKEWDRMCKIIGNGYKKK